jgi:cellobiose transport system permease protein
MNKVLLHTDEGTAGPGLDYPGRRVRPRLRSRLDRTVSPYAYIAPFFIIFGVFSLFPILYTSWVSLHDWDIIGTHSWAGLDNYAELMSDPRFWGALRNTFSIFVLSAVPQLLLALVLAHVLNERRIRGRTFFRMSLLVPNITSIAAVAIIFESIFNVRYGIMNWFIETIGLDPVNWQVNTLASHVAISSMVMWRWTGYNALIYLASLQAIPRDLYDAAAIDGAGRWQQFRYVTIPGIRPAIIFTVIISTIGSLQIIAEPLLFATGAQNGITGGSARQFQTLSLYMYEQAFRRFELGYASAIAWLLFLIIVVAASVNYLFIRRLRGAGDD